MFRVGQKVVCVNDGKIGIGIPWLADRPKLGEIYTITGFCKSCLDGSLALYLIEIKNLGRQGYRACRFRPVVERKTDISIFTKMLIDAKQPALSAVEVNESTNVAERQS